MSLLRRSTIAVTLACVAALSLTSVTPAVAATFSNPATITLPDPNCTDPDPATPYPSTINVSGVPGTLADVNVTFTGMTHVFEGDYEMLLVAPGGQNLLVLSDAGTGALNNATVTFDDAAASAAPQNIGWGPGTYKPTNYTEITTGDTFPAPAPSPSANTTLAAFNGISPNGTWSLYVVDDACDGAGSISGGWSLDITGATAAGTSTSVISSLNPSRTGQSVTFTATVTSGGPVTTGTVTFTEGATTLAANVPVNGSGQAAFTTSSLVEGDHNVTATYNGNATFATSNASVNQRVDNNTVVNGNTFCNTGPIAMTTILTGPAFPYPSNIFVTGTAGLVSDVDVRLLNLSQGFNGDFEVLLVGPAGQNLVILSDAGTAPVTNVSLDFDDAAGGSLPAAGTWGADNSTITVKPTNYTELFADTFAPPAPAPSGAATLATFNNTNANGTWSLYVTDDGAPDTGSIAGGWCLDLTVAPPTTTTTTSTTTTSTTTTSTSTTSTSTTSTSTTLPPTTTSTSTTSTSTTSTSTTTIPATTTTTVPAPCATPTIVGTGGPDVIVGTPGPDVIAGGGGDDSIAGLGGDDVICGEGGDDTLNGDNGNDTLRGGTGDDDLFGRAGDDQLSGGSGNDTIIGGNGNDDAVGNEGADTVNGGEGDDFVAGGDDNDSVGGGAGDDHVEGNDGDDRVNGNNGNDELEGNKGVDVLKASDGLAFVDTLAGGPATDACTSDATDIPSSLAGGDC